MSRIKNFIRWARVTAALAGSKQFPVQQMEYMGKTADGFMVFPYGLFANVPKDTLALMMAIQGNPDNRAAIPCSVDNRPTLNEGEPALYHPLIPDLKIVLQSNGRMLIKSLVGVDVEAPEATFSGNVTIAGDLSVTGDTALGATVTSNGKDISETHTHGGVTTGAGSTGVPN